MKEPVDVDALLRQMSTSGVPVDDPARAAGLRARTVPRITAFHAELLERRSATARWRRRAGVIAAAAAIVLGVGFLSVRRGSPRPAAAAVSAHGAATLARVSLHTVLIHAGAAAPVAAGAALASGDGVRVDDGAAGLALSSGAEVAVSAPTELQYEAPQVAGWMHESLRVERGQVLVHVPKLPPGGTFRVVTPDAVVEVHGTRFSVSFDRYTKVAVSEGRVSAESHGQTAFVDAGGTWSSAPAAPVPLPDVGRPSGSSAEKPVAIATARTASAAPASPHADDVAVPTSTLAQQNRLYQQAMDARRRGDDRAALAVLDQFLARYPGSPLVEDARIERVRALKRLGQADAAAREARRYLADHPEGFARDEARETALDPQQ